MGLIPERYQPLPGSLFADVYESAEAELDGKDDDEDLDLLEDNPLMWMRALRNMDDTLSNMVGMGRMSLEPLKPAPGTNESQAYMQARKHVVKTEQQIAQRRATIATRIQEVKSIISDQPIGSIFLGGEIVSILEGVIRLVEDNELQSAVKLAQRTINRIREHRIDKKESK